MADSDFMMAFAAVRVAKDFNEGLSDERYVKWMGTKVTREGVNVTRNRFYLHRCSDEEFSRFYQIENEVEARLIAKLQAEGHFYCVDWKITKDLFGYWKSASDFSLFDAAFVSCASTDDQACVMGEQEVKEYVSDDWSMLVYHNQ